MTETPLQPLSMNRQSGLADHQTQVRVAVIWVNFGPYHLARIFALHKLMDIRAIELAPLQFKYGWSAERGPLSLITTTLSTGPFEIQNPLRLAAATWNALSKQKPRVVLLPGYSELPALAGALWCRLHAATSVLMSETTASDLKRGRWQEQLKKCIVKAFFQYAMVGGRRSRDYINRLGIPPARIHGYYDVVDNEYFGNGTALLRSDSSPITHGLPQEYFLCVGRLAPEKNIETLIEAYSLYRARGGKWHLVVVGDGPLRGKLAELCTQSSFSATIHFAGFKNGDELLPYYAFAKCFVLPSVKEAWGLVVNEAMAAGLPVLVSNCCGCSDDLVRNGDNGFTFHPSDPVQLSSLMREISSSTESVRSAQGQRSREIIAEFSPRAFASEVKRIVDLEISKL